MNDAEFTDCVSRENQARAAGWTSKMYKCFLCIFDGCTEAQAVYSDWPKYFMFGQAICDLHAEHRLQRR